MQPEEKLQQQSAIARTQSQNQKAKRQGRPTDTSATIIGYNAALNKNIIQRSDGSINYAGSDTNGAVAIGDTVPLHGGTMRVDGLPYIKKQPVVAKKAPLPKVTYPVKVLFSVVNVETGNRDFYIGGDRKIPNLIFSLSDINIQAYLCNTGEKTTDWIATFAAISAFGQVDSTDGIYIVTPSNTFYYNYSTDIVPTLPDLGPSYGQMQWSFQYLNGGYSLVSVGQPETSQRDDYYIYKSDIWHIANIDINTIIDVYPMPGVRSDTYFSILLSPLVDEAIANTSTLGFHYIDRLLIGKYLGNSPVLSSIDNRLTSLVKRILYSPQVYAYNNFVTTEGVDFRATGAEVEITSHKIENDGTINQLTTIKTKVFNLKSPDSTIHSISYFPFPK